MKKALTLIGVALIGSFAVLAIDAFVGVSFGEDVTMFAKITHTVVHMLWGGILMAAVWRLWWQ